MNWYPIIVTVLTVLVTLLAAVWSYKISKRKADDERREVIDNFTEELANAATEQRVEFGNWRNMMVSFYHGKTMDLVNLWWVMDTDTALIFRQPLDTPIRLVIQGFDGDIIRTITRYFRAPDEIEPDRVGPHAD